MTPLGNDGADTARRIVVGFDGSPNSVAALDWAVIEAHLHRLPLTLCHAWNRPHRTETGRRPGDPDQVLRLGVEHVERGPAPIRLTPELVRGHAARALVDVSAGNALLVVGARGTGGFPGLRLGSVASQVTRHARGPVVIVRAPGPRHRHRRIVVGVDGSAATDAAVAFAFAEARSRGARVHAVHTWDAYSVLTAAYLAESELDSLRLAEERRLAEALQPHADTHPEVEISVELSHSAPGPVLVAASAGAELLVVGSRDHGGFSTLLLGSTSEALLHHASCPVLVVRPGADPWAGHRVAGAAQADGSARPR